MSAGTTSPPPGPVLWEETLHGGQHWQAVVRRGVALRLTDVEGGANASMLVFNHEDRVERYNMPDTLKAQHTAVLTVGHTLMSDMGRVLASVIEDTAGPHDTVCGVLDDARLRERFGERRFGTHRNAMFRSGKEGFLKELGKAGLTRRDLHANVNWFSKVTVDDAGRLHFDVTAARPGRHIDLRFDMHALVIVSTCPHPLDPRTEWAPKPVHVTAWRCGLADATDRCRLACDQNRRAFVDTERYFAA